MKRTFIEVPLFTKRWQEIGLNTDDLLALQILLLKDPTSGPLMEGTGGIRKVRFPLENMVLCQEISHFNLNYFLT